MQSPGCEHSPYRSMHCVPFRCQGGPEHIAGRMPAVDAVVASGLGCQDKVHVLLGGGVRVRSTDAQIGPGCRPNYSWFGSVCGGRGSKVNVIACVSSCSVASVSTPEGCACTCDCSWLEGVVGSNSVGCVDAEDCVDNAVVFTIRVNISCLHKQGMVHKDRTV
jgi:hypothetical protein